MHIVAIAARSSNNVMGNKGTLPWPHNKQDLQWFKNITNGDPLIMGRITFESLPGILPNRHHYVVTSNPELPEPQDNVTFVNYSDIDKLLSELEYQGNTHVFIVGGAKLFELTGNRCSTLMLRTFNKPYEGDVLFPDVFDCMKLVMVEHWDDSVTETYIRL